MTAYQWYFNHFFKKVKTPTTYFLPRRVSITLDSEDCLLAQCTDNPQEGNEANGLCLHHTQPKSLEKVSSGNSKYQGHLYNRKCLSCRKANILWGICTYTVFTVNNRKYFLFLPNCSCFCRQLCANYYST